MKTSHWVKGSGLAVALTISSGGALSHGDSHNTAIYKGDASARNVCMSIVRDDVGALKSALRSERRAAYERTNAHFQCNSLALDEFAFQQGAEATGSYLAPLYGHPRGSVRIEQVGTIEE
jgi:hypothetical protein